MRKSNSLIFVAAILVAAGCNNDQPPKAPDNTSSAASPTPPPMAESDASPGSTMMIPGASTTESNAPADRPSAMPSSAEPAVVLSDEQILQITHVANRGEIEQAKLALAKAKDPRVKTFATLMMKAHADADAKGLALAKKDHLTTQASTASADLESSAKDATRTLKEQEGSDFDTNYVDTQVKEHQAVLDTIDQKLVPNAQNEDLKAYLADVRPAVAMHLQHAKDLQSELTQK